MVISEVGIGRQKDIDQAHVAAAHNRTPDQKKQTVLSTNHVCSHERFGFTRLEDNPTNSMGVIFFLTKGPPKTLDKLEFAPS